jgi:hypothetical protein
MKRIVRLTESDLTRIVRRVINEQEQTAFPKFDSIRDGCDKGYIEPKGGKSSYGPLLFFTQTNNAECWQGYNKNFAIDCKTEEFLVNVKLTNPAANYYTVGHKATDTNGKPVKAFGTHENQYGKQTYNHWALGGGDVPTTLRGYCSTLTKYYADKEAQKAKTVKQ